LTIEFGKGFCFVARQKLMRYEEEDFYVDIGDFLRALGGEATSHDDEPNEGKQKFNLKFNR
jgi:hypothetical protein